MMPMCLFRLAIFFIIILHNAAYLYAQSPVSDIKEEVKKDKTSRTESSGTDDSGDNDLGSSFIGFLISDVLFELIAPAQSLALAKDSIYKERSSLLLPATFGLDNHDLYSNITIALRGNWGLFSSEVRFHQFNDRFETLNSIDYQIAILRIPVLSVNLEAGLGLIRLLDPEYTYGEYLIGIQWRLANKLTNLSIHRRGSFNNESDIKFRKETSIELYHILDNAPVFKIAPMVLYRHQNYFNKFSYHFFGVGINIIFE